jgi:hypothetical protein
MSTPSPGWRETLIVALRRTLDIEYSAGQVPGALREVSGHRMPVLEESIRRQYWHADLPGFAWPLHAQPDEEAIDAQLFCAGCHRDGRIRERALRLMRGRRGHIATVLALIRCDDWVPQVRLCAEDALRQIVAADPAALFAHLDLLFALRARLRMQSGVWRTLLDPLLLAPSNAAARWAALDDSRHPLFVCELILRADPAQAEALALHTLQHRDPVVVRWGVRELLHVPGLSVSDDLIALALRHPNAPVRAHALRARARTDDDGYRALLQEFLLDPSASVRSVAAYATRALGLDPRDTWRDTLDHGSAPGTHYALLGLGDRAEAEDLARIAPWLRHTTGELRCAALRGALRAGIDDPAAQLRDALASPSSKVVALALKLGATVPAFMTRETLAQAFATAANPRTRQRIVDATRQLGRWDALDCLLDGIDHDAYADDARNGLLAWQREIGQRYAPLSADRKRALLQRIDATTRRNMHTDWLPIRRVVESA